MITSIILIVAVLSGLNQVNLQDPKPLDPSTDKRVDRPMRHEDDGSGLNFEDDKPRIDQFAEGMKRNKSYTGYIIAYGGLVSYKNEAKIRLRCIRNHLKTAHGIPSSRLKLIDGGYRVEISVRLFVVKPEDPKPTPYGLVNRKAIRMRKRLSTPAVSRADLVGRFSLTLRIRPCILAATSQFEPILNHRRNWFES
jgi:hypothetical protein